MATNKKSKQGDSALTSSSILAYLLYGYCPYELEKIDIKYKCPYCSSMMKEPIQLTECGHRTCKGCFESRATDAIKDMMVCPVPDCKTEFHKTQVKLFRYFSILEKQLDCLFPFI